MALKSFAILVAGLSLAFADNSISSNLPILYRVDQPSSNVVVFRGANVKLAQQSGYFGSLFSKGNSGDQGDQGDSDGKGDNSGDHNGNGNDYERPTTKYNPPPPPTTTTPYTTTTAYTTTTPYTTTTTYKPPVVYTTKPPVVYTNPPVVYTNPPKVYTNTYKPHNSYPQATHPTKYNAYNYAPVEANYDWEYAVKEHYNDFGHKESRHGYAATGVYYVALPDGRFQTVRYTADKDGFRPEVVYEGSASYPEEKAAYGKPSYSS